MTQTYGASPQSSQKKGRSMPKKANSYTNKCSHNDHNNSQSDKVISSLPFSPQPAPSLGRATVASLNSQRTYLGPNNSGLTASASFRSTGPDPMDRVISYLDIWLLLLFRVLLNLLCPSCSLSDLRLDQFDFLFHFLLVQLVDVHLN